MITKQLRANAAGDPVLSIRVTGASDVYRFAFGMQTLQVEFARKGALALRGLRRLVGTVAYGRMVDAFHGSGRETGIDRRGSYERGYADAIADNAELVALAVCTGFGRERILDAIPQPVFDSLLERGLLHEGAAGVGEGFTDTNTVGIATLIAAVTAPTAGRKAVAA